MGQSGTQLLSLLPSQRGILSKVSLVDYITKGRHGHQRLHNGGAFGSLIWPQRVGNVSGGREGKVLEIKEEA